MTLLVKDANTAIQPISTQLDAAANLVPVHVPASVPAAGGIATPVSTAAPLPVINTAGSVAVDGSGSITTGGTAQTLFSGTIPTNGYMIGNTSTANHTLYVSDVGTASATGSSMPIASGTIFATPPGYKPPGAVSIFSTTTSDTYSARRW